MDRTSFEKLHVYRLAEELADLAWNVVLGWSNLARDTIGKQLIRSADSVGANLAEGLGRGSSAEKCRYGKIARGSLFEVKHWLRRAHKRGLLSDDKVESFHALIDELTPRLSAYIRSIEQRSSEKFQPLNTKSLSQPATHKPEAKIGN